MHNLFLLCAPFERCLEEEAEVVTSWEFLGLLTSNEQPNQMFNFWFSREDLQLFYCMKLCMYTMYKYMIHVKRIDQPGMEFAQKGGL